MVVESLKETLLSRGFNTDSLHSLLGPVQLDAVQASPSPRLLYLTRESAPLHTLVRLFLLGVPVPQSAAAAALRPLPLRDLVRARVLKFTGDSAIARMRIASYGDQMIAFDGPDQAKKRDFVPGPSDSSIFLTLFTIRRRFASVLDLGAGCGVQSLWAAQHSTAAWATDINPRALEFVRFNAALNGIRAIRPRLGDAFEPVKRRRFDLILGNLPFVVGPKIRLTYRDNSRPLDSFAQEIVRDAPAHLSTGGFAQFLFQWVELAGEPWRERVANWFQGTGCDAWLIKTTSQTPDLYVEKWLNETEPTSATAARFAGWMKYLERVRVTAIHTGAVTMRYSPARRNWLRIDETSMRATAPLGDTILRRFEATDYVSTLTDDHQVLRLRPKLALGVRIVRKYGELCQLVLHTEFQDTLLADVRVTHLDGLKTVRELLKSTANTASARLLADVREAVERGFLDTTA
ncbi:MAG TPA: methyltransferase [Bryobacteraceae bacterium]|nr:methyltransferase [Bryobacteraceae bacterium]